MTAKEILRGEIKKRLKNIPAEEFRSQGAAAAALLRSAPIWSQFKTLFLFLSMSREIDTQPILAAALEDGKKVFAPKTEAGRLCFYPLLSADGPWLMGPFGIREPAHPSPGPAEWKPAGAGDFPALILSPGLAFDREGKRLGRGGGYYDRFFAELDEADREYSSLGFCMEAQIVDQVPAGNKDKKMNGLLSGTELLYFP